MSVSSSRSDALNFRREMRKRMGRGRASCIVAAGNGGKTKAKEIDTLAHRSISIVFLEQSLFSLPLVSSADL